MTTNDTFSLIKINNYVLICNEIKRKGGVHTQVYVSL